MHLLLFPFVFNKPQTDRRAYNVVSTANRRRIRLTTMTSNAY